MVPHRELLDEGDGCDDKQVENFDVLQSQYQNVDNGKGHQWGLCEEIVLKLFSNIGVLVV